MRDDGTGLFNILDLSRSNIHNMWSNTISVDAISIKKRGKTSLREITDCKFRRTHWRGLFIIQRNVSATAESSLCIERD